MRQKVNGAKILKSPTPIFCLLFIFLYLWPLIYHLSNRFHTKGARAGTSAIGFFFFFKLRHLVNIRKREPIQFLVIFNQQIR